jgi:RNA polymerase sigma-70 factor (ECF subfamily)
VAGSESILARIAAGDGDAVQACLDRYGGLVWSLARRFCYTQAEAEDAVQEIFLDVWRSAARYDERVASEPTFVAMIARRRLIDRRRRAGREIDARLLSPETDRADGGSRRPAESVEISEEAAAAARALEALRPEQQRVLRLSIYQGLSHEKIAEATGLPLGTVKTHVRRGLIRIREMLQAGGPGSAGGTRGADGAGGGRSAGRPVESEP